MITQRSDEDVTSQERIAAGRIAKVKQNSHRKMEVGDVSSLMSQGKSAAEVFQNDKAAVQKIDDIKAL